MNFERADVGQIGRANGSPVPPVVRRAGVQGDQERLPIATDVVEQVIGRTGAVILILVVGALAVDQANPRATVLEAVGAGIFRSQADGHHRDIPQIPHLSGRQLILQLRIEPAVGREF